MAPSIELQEDSLPALTTGSTSTSHVEPDHLTPTPGSQVWSPQSVLSSIPPQSQYTPHTSSPVSFFHLLARLKTTKREGWRRFGISHGESIADHMYRMSILTMLAPESLASKLDIQRCTKMALIHDMAESLVGDITPVDGVLKTEKSRREAGTMDYICTDLLGKVEGGFAGRNLRQIWQEYEDGKTSEAKFVKDIDKIELVLQMVEYEKEREGKLDLGEFSWVADRITMPEVREWCRDVLRERDAYWKELGIVPSGGDLAGDREEQQVEYYRDEEGNGGSV